MLVSIAVKTGMFSVSFYYNGSELYHYTEKYKGKDKYERMLFILRKILPKVDKYIRENNITDIITFEMVNSVVVRWFQDGESTPKYFNEFCETLDKFYRIPMRYNFIVSTKPKAVKYLDEKYIVKNEVFTVENLLSM